MSIEKKQTRSRFFVSICFDQGTKPSGAFPLFGELLAERKCGQRPRCVSSNYVFLLCLLLTFCPLQLFPVSGTRSDPPRNTEGHVRGTPSAVVSSACNTHSEDTTPTETSSHPSSQTQGAATDALRVLPARTLAAISLPLSQTKNEGVRVLSGLPLGSPVPLEAPSNRVVPFPCIGGSDLRSLSPEQRPAELLAASENSTSVPQRADAKTRTSVFSPGRSRTSATRRTGRADDSENISILGRVGQNAEINGEYALEDGQRNRGEKASERPVYRKKQMPISPQIASAASQAGERAGATASSPLYLFHVESSESATPAFWAVGEVPGVNERIRAFVLSDADTPDKAEGEWMVFEKSVALSAPRPEEPPAITTSFHADPYVVAVRVSCHNGARDGGETGLDCGGETCESCDQFRSCRLPGVLPAGGYALGDCPRNGRLAHGEACTYKCPLGWREKGALGRICYDGTVLEIRRGAGCERAFDLPENATQNCQFLLLEGAPELQQKCNGLFISHIVTGMSGQQAVFWQKDVRGDLVQLYWDDGYWICGSFEKDEEYGYLPDMTPERLIQARSIHLLSSEAVWSNAAGPQASTAPASLHCVDPLQPLQHTQEGGRCPTFFFSGWSSPGLDGYWHELFPPSADGRPRFINEELLLIHWTPLGYWVVGVPDDDTIAIALSFSPSKFPAPNGWRIWNAKTGLWEEEESVRARCVPTDDRESGDTDPRRGGNSPRQNYTSTRNSHYGFPAPLLDISPSPGLHSPFPHGGHGTSQTRSGLLEGLISPEEGDLRLREEGRTLQALHLPKRRACPHLRLEGGVGLGARCNGVWSRRVYSRGRSNGRAASRGSYDVGSPADGGNPESEDADEYYLFKLSIDSRVMYLYKSDDQWRCTADGNTMLGFSNKNVTLHSSLQEKENPGNARTNFDELHSGEAHSEEGNWLEGLRYVSGPWKLSCLDEDGKT
ncbi:Large protein with signal peptide. cysteine-rich,threonine-rich, possible mucin, related [Neospora caninum Liverpool]|uniref:Large protein with signal peptide. cysteine-rich,threonine-rich, possible mucin, related n=1 Tax=Neospora caninum (strain Liverpool) TaxID=572307 RepID=F0VMH6_NEOCL|nr:Large protein with signal peptide. cysteine-rich,threonine-rich, possible mucin, related [Neospora caninum Liverpool]CBZ54922.1 Large protein with signal peptide. cysteine-rich,threonine-rich, possible mucin, related [Neospora caninum Liverpool]|eukprot:XP_003884950.1 Large protein with signal peptide. cysteine-rich,threonine-rich, possible mucin, related [Neospora caninum Liverpool]